MLPRSLARWPGSGCADPGKPTEAQAALVRGYLELWNNALQRMIGQDVAPVVEPEPGDSRFKDPEWSSNPYFDFWKQAYLVTTQWAEDILDKTEGLDERTRQRAEFYLRQLLSALSPSNFPLTNPEVLRETLATNAENLVQGMQQLRHGHQEVGRPAQCQPDRCHRPFEVGKNLAITPGKVVCQNDILQLIQYAPTTDKVREVPLLIVPPWINKYYILDLTPAKSLIKFAVEQGFTVFIVSWVNPDQRLSHKTFEDYMNEGILAAADAVKRETGVEKTNVVGLLRRRHVARRHAGLSRRARTRSRSTPRRSSPRRSTSRRPATCLLFTDEAQLEALEEMMAERGYLDGSRMAKVFNMLRPRDLIWPYIVNNYLLGKKPFPFDLLYWNQDSTRMPAANHNFYLREFYNENRLARGQMALGGVRLDLGKVKLPIYELATKEDHIAPAKSVYVSSRLFGGAGRVRPGWLGPHRRRRQSAARGRQEAEVPVLDQSGSDGHIGGMAARRKGDARLLVAALDQVAGVAFRQHGGRAPAGRQARRYRGCAGVVCGSESIGPADLSVGQAQCHLVSVQLSEKAKALVLNGRFSRSRGQGLPAACTPLRVNRAPSAGMSTVQTP